MSSSQTLKKIITALIISVLLNISLITYHFIHEEPSSHKVLSPSITSPSPIEITELILNYWTLPIKELTQRLNDTTLVSHGLHCQDYALAVMVQRHHFDLDRALKGCTHPIELRTLTWKNSEEKKDSLTLYINLNERDFEQIHQFIDKEKWPYNSEGLHKMITQNNFPHARSELIYTFQHTRTFYFFESLFKDCKMRDPQHLINLLISSSWEDLNTIETQDPNLALQNDLNIRKDLRRHYLMQQIEKEQAIAAYWILISDLNYVIHTFDDGQILHLLNHLSEPTHEVLILIQSLLNSPRSDTVIKKAEELAQAYELSLSSTDEDTGS
jgi:hypothetical protein